MLYHPESFMITCLAFCTYFMIYFVQVHIVLQIILTKRKKKRKKKDERTHSGLFLHISFPHKCLKLLTDLYVRATYRHSEE